MHQYRSLECNSRYTHIGDEEIMISNHGSSGSFIGEAIHIQYSDPELFSKILAALE